jgi:hypothetical protein
MGIKLHQEECIMKQRLAIILVVLSLLVALAGVAAAPMAASTVRLVGVQYVPQKGPVFTFEVTGNFSRSALKGTVNVQGGGNYPLYCTQIDDTTVKCNTSQKVATVNVSVTFGGSTFWAYVPGAPDRDNAESEEYCYSIWDWWDFTAGEWTDFGPYCQNDPAVHGDQVWYTVPHPEETFEAPVWFVDEDAPEECNIPNYGPAYYWTGCFSLEFELLQ